MVYGVRTDPCWKFVWNFHMLKDVCTLLHSDWLLYVIHGFIGQSSILYVIVVTQIHKYVLYITQMMAS